MRKITIICIGSLKENYWVQAINEYQKRIQRFFDFKIIELSETKLPNKPSKKDIQKALQDEAKKVIALTKQKIVCPLCIEGKQLDSIELSHLIAQYTDQNELCFVIGSSFGLDDSIKSLGTQLSFGKMTLPHQLMRVVLTEQIYRAGTILNNIEYHK